MTLITRFGADNVEQYLPQLLPHRDEVVRYLKLYYGVG